MQIIVNYKMSSFLSKMTTDIFLDGKVICDLDETEISEYIKVVLFIYLLPFDIIEFISISRKISQTRLRKESEDKENKKKEKAKALKVCLYIIV